MSIETKVLITNGNISAEDVMFFVNEGWYWVKEMDASLVHPHALPEDKVSVFIRYKEAKEITVETSCPEKWTQEDVERATYRLKEAFVKSSLIF